jgi:predicted MPP superfamily phosphohydrolase
MKRRIRKLLFGRLILTLSLLLGVMQVVVGHWVTVVLAGRAGPGLGVGLALAALLVAGNAYLVPVLRQARRRGGFPAVIARAYMGLGVGTILLGMAAVAIWLGFLPVGGLLSLLGVSAEWVFQIFRVVSIPIVATIAGMLLWGFTVGQAHVAHTHLRIALEDLPEDLRGLRIVQTSDLHIGNVMEGRRLERLVARINALDPDLVVVTGDIFDFDPSVLERGSRALAGLRARYGVFAVLGNHDTYVGTEKVAAALRDHAPALRLLRGEVVRVPLSAPLYLAGIDDPGRDWTARGVDLPGLQELSDEIPCDGPTILLVHRPEAFPQANRLGFPLVLAGHTHGGQLALPSFGGHLNLARLVTRYHRGLFRENGSVLYVNRGAGVAGPAVRINCPREITTIELVSEFDTGVSACVDSAPRTPLEDVRGASGA